MPPTQVLFVCLGNICRSPSAQGVFRQLVRTQNLSGAITSDSAGTGSWHVGKPPDERAQKAAQNRGLDISDLRARQVSPADFLTFDHIIAMDDENLADLAALCPLPHANKICRLLDFAPGNSQNPGDPQNQVPDPYYGGDEGFEHMLDLIEAGAAGLLAHIRTQT